MLKIILLFIIPGMLFSANTSFERPSQVSKNANPNHGKKFSPKKTKKQQAQIDKVNKEKKQVSKHIDKTTKSSSANLKKSVMKNPKAQAARKKAVAERRMKAAKSRRK